MVTVIRPGAKDPNAPGQMSQESRERLLVGQSNLSAIVLCSDNPRALQTASLIAPNGEIQIRYELIFDPNLESAYGMLLRQSFREKRFLRFLAEESDALAMAHGETDNFHYSLAVKTVAELLDKCLRLDRDSVIITHTGFAECYLADSIRKSDGDEACERFIESLNGFELEPLEGFQTDGVTIKRYKL